MSRFVILMLMFVHPYYLGIDLKVAAKFFGQRFATGSSANNAGEIVIQGDVKHELMELIPQKWTEVTTAILLVHISCYDNN